MTDIKLAFRSSSPDITRSLGAALASVVVDCKDACVIALNGELGAGKTTFVSGFLKALGITGPVRSPTYTLIEPYEVAGHLIYHLDLYRIASPKELEMLALRDLIVPGAVLLIEWAERGESELPPPDLSVALRYSAPNSVDERAIALTAHSPRGKELASSLQRMSDELGVSPSFY